MANTPRIDRLENNKIINGNFDFWQRGTSLSIGPTDQAYLADRWKVVGPGSSAIVTASRSASVPTFAESGFQSAYSHDINVTTADVSASNHYLSYRLEGYDLQPIHKKKVTLSFWIYATKTGTSCVTFNNSADDRGYPVEFTIDSSNTWEKKSITIDLDQNGTWLLDAGIGLGIRFILNNAVAQQGTADVWQSGAIYGTSNQINHLDTIGNRYRIAQVILNEGEVAGSFSRAGRTISEELQMCQRYYEKSYDLDVIAGAITSIGRHCYQASNTTFHREEVSYKIYKRAAASIIVYGHQSGATDVAQRDSGVPTTMGNIVSGEKGFTVQGASQTANGEYGFHWTADAEL